MTAGKIFQALSGVSNRVEKGAEHTQGMLQEAHQEPDGDHADSGQLNISPSLPDEVATMADIGTILSDMNRCKGGAKVQENGCREYYCEADTVTKIASEDAIPAVLRAMRSHKGNVNVQVNGCLTLRNNSRLRDNSNKVKIASEDGIVTVLEAMQRHEEALEVQAYGCSALANLCWNDDNQVKVASEGGIATILMPCGDIREMWEFKEVASAPSTGFLKMMAIKSRLLLREALPLSWKQREDMRKIWKFKQRVAVPLRIFVGMIMTIK